MNLQENIIILKSIAEKIANKLHCDRHGSCVHFAEIFVDKVNKQYPELLNDFEVIEGYVNVKFGDGIPQEHTWIKLSNGDIIDPTFSQFDKYDKNAQYSKKRTKVYSGQEYYDEGKEGSWFSERRKKLPSSVFKKGLQESIRRILREETNSIKNLNESKTSQHLKLINNLLEPFKEKDCVCDIRVFFDVEDNDYNIYLVFSQEELHDKFSDLYGIRSYISKMQGEVKTDLESFIPIRNIFIGYYTKPNCEWSPLNESENKKSGLLRAIEEDGLYQVMQDTGLTLPQIYTKTGELPREVFVRYIKDFLNQEGYHQTNGSVLLPHVIELHTNVFIENFYLERDKVTLEINEYDKYGQQVTGFIESISNLSDEELFTIVDKMPM